ncbi:MAG: glycosyltransferase family 4 protein [Acidobacteria bacterium]|nr:glycosyltransferase family 4 protein [Acidobacteriota bacterium]
MRVNVASFSGTHPLDLARELDKAGLLGTYYSALPRFRIAGLPRERTVTHPSLLLPHYVLRRLGLSGLEFRISWTTTEAFDRWLARTIGPSDVFHVLSSYGLRAMRRARSEYGALTVCDRGSSHIRFVDELLRAEYARYGIRFVGIEPQAIVKEETEYRESDVVVVPSTFAKRSFVAAGLDPGKVVAIPYGVRLEDYFPTGKRDGVFRVLCVAVLSVRKGIGYLLEAWSGLTLPDSELVLRGAMLPESGPMLAGHEGRFRLHPSLPRKQMRDLFSQASVLVLPSLEDGFGLVITQAMACGVPVIATTNTGGPDLITDGTDGFIVPSRDADAIRDRLDYLYRHPDVRDAMGRAAIEKVRSLRGWGEYARQVAQMYQERLARRHAH